MSGGKGGSQQTTTTTKPPEYLAPYLKGLAGDAQGAYEQGQMRIDPYEGPRVAQVPGSLASSWQMTADQAGDQQLLNSAGGSLLDAMTPQYQSEQLQGVKEAAIADIMPGINASFAGSGMAGGTGHQEALAKGLARGIAPIEYGAYQSAANRGLSAAGMAPGIDAARYTGAQQLGEVGAQQYGYGQSLLDANRALHYEQQSAPYDELSRYGSLLLGQAAPFSSQTQTGGYSPGFSDYLGLGLSGLGMFLSDERAKTDIRRVGETDNGLGVYTYRYMAGGPVHMGVMAQEVERVAPHAVAEIDGLKHVDYSEIS